MRSHGASRRGPAFDPRVALAAAVVVVALIVAFLFLHKNNGPSDGASTPPVTGPSKVPVDAAIKSDLRTVANEFEVWFTDHNNYRIEVLPVGVTLGAGDHVIFKLSKDGQGYCLMGWNAKGTAIDPTAKMFYFYDSKAGGLQSGPTALDPSGTCPASVGFKPLG